MPGDMGRVGEGLEDFCRDEYPRLVGSPGLYCGNADVAEELAQETIARICRDWEKVSWMASPSAWAHRVGFNLANSFFRRRAAERRALQRLGAVGASLQSRDLAESVVIRRAVASLPRRQRTVLVLRYYLDMSVAEVAATMECPEGTVKTLTRKATNSLRAKLSDAEEERIRHVV